MRRRSVQASSTCFFRHNTLELPGYTFEQAVAWDDTGSRTLLAEGKSLQDDSNVLAKIAPAHSNGSMCLEREAHIIERLQSTPEAMSISLRLIDYFNIPEENGDCFVLLVVHPGLNLLGRYFPPAHINQILLADTSSIPPPEPPPQPNGIHDQQCEDEDASIPIPHSVEEELEGFKELPVSDVMDLTSFLEFAIQATHCLELLHNAGLMHREIRANAFHHNAHTGSVRFAHFGNRCISLEEAGGPSTIVIRAESLPTPERVKVQDAVCYLAPEQTGVISPGAGEDHRTDLYSLGVLFWALLAGQGKMPFEGGPMDLLHAIGQKIPMLVNAVRRDLPRVLAEIVDKLLAKNPDDRYNSAYGLKADLMNCQERLLLAVTELSDQSSELIPRFEIGKEDLYQDFTLPHTLFGREKELEIIQNVILHFTTSHSNQYGTTKTMYSSSNGTTTNLTPIEEGEMARSSAGESCSGGSRIPSAQGSGSSGGVGGGVNGTAGGGAGVQNDINPKLFQPTLSPVQEPAGLERTPSPPPAPPPSAVTPRSSASGSTTGTEGSLRRLTSERSKRPRTVIVVGPAGAGKSSLMMAHQAQWRAGGLWGQTKFQSKDSSPFSSLLQCLSVVLRQLMLYRSDVHRFVSALRTRLGPQMRNLSLLYHAAPELRDIMTMCDADVGASTELPQADELRARFRSLVENVFIVVTEVRMLALCLDDLHEADDQSLDLLYGLTNTTSRILILLTLRNENAEKLERVRTMFSTAARTTWIDLGPLPYASVLELTAKTLHRSRDSAAPLARLIHRLSGGNAFSTRNLLVALHRQKLIVFNRDHNHWEFDLTAIEASLADQALATEISDLSYILSHLRSLPTDARKFIIWAGLFGSTFKTNDVQLMMDWEYAQTNGDMNSDSDSDDSAPTMWDLTASEAQMSLTQFRGATNGMQLAIADGWIVQRGRDSAAFAHDRYLQAAQAEFAALSRGVTEKMCFRIVIMLMHETVVDAYRVAEYAKRCVSIVREHPRCAEIVDLIITAADDAWTRGSHELALQALSNASALLGTGWDKDPERALSLRTRLSELLTWRGDCDKSDELIAICMERPLESEQKARLLRIRSRNHWLRKNFREALHDTIYALHALGVEVVSSPSVAKADEMFETVKDEILALGFDQILAIPRTEDPRMELATKLLNEASTHAFWSAGDDLADVVGLTTIQLGLKHGMCSGTALGFLYVVTAAAERRELYRFSADLGKLALRLADKHGGSMEKCRAQILYCNMVSGFDNIHIRTNITRCRMAEQYGDSAGDRIFTSLALLSRIQSRLYVCEHMEDLIVAAEEMLGTIEAAMPTTDTVVLATGLVNCIRALGGYTNSWSAETALDTDTFVESEYLESVRKTSGNVNLVLNWYNAFKVVALFCLGFVDEAAELGFSVYETKHTHPNYRHNRFASCYHSLALIAILRNGGLPEEKTKRYQAQIKLNQDYIRKWLPSSPVNTSTWVALVDAEIASLKGDPEALKLYDVAVKLAINNEWLLEEGWALYLQGSHFVRIGVEGLGKELQHRGINRQARWGARGIVDALEARLGVYNPLLVKRSVFSVEVAVQTESVVVDNTPRYRPQDQTSDSKLVQDDDDMGSLSSQDLLSVLRWSKEISLDMNSSSGLQRLTEIASEISGAQLTCVAVAREAGDFTLATSLSPPDLCQVYESPRPIKSLSDPLLKTVMAHVLSTRQRLCVDDAAEDPRFRSDAESSFYRTVACIPLYTNRGPTLGAVYLASQYPFPRPIVTCLTLLCQQASISVANAFLFRSIQSGTRENLKMIATQRAALDEARRSREEAVKATKIKSNFLASMSHELRTPFSSFYGLLDLLSGTELNAGQQEIVQTAKQSCELLLKIIDSILDYSKLEASALKLELSSFAIEDLIADCMELLLPVAAKKLDMSFDIAPGVPEWILADDTRIRQVLMNLMGNACKFTAEGSVCVTCALDTTPPRRASEVFLRITIRDTGIGLSAGDVESLFIPFHQADNSTTRRFGGTGLGLSISRQLITLMEGQIGVESQLGVGSTFWFRIPVQVIESEESRQAQADIDNMRTQLMQPQPVRTLICSPMAATRSLLATMLDGFPTSYISTIDELEKDITDRDPNLATFDFIIIDDQSETRVDKLAREWQDNDMKATAKIIHLYIPTSETLSRNPRWGTLTTGLTRVTKPPRRARLLRTMASLSDRPGTDSKPRHSDISKAIQDLASVQRRLYGNVLVAEDNPVARQLLIKQLELKSLNVIATTNGLEAIEEWERHGPNYFSIALFDHHMPVCDGVEAAKKLRLQENKLKSSFRLPIVALSADCQESTKQLCLSSGMNAFFSKPLRKSDLSSILSMFEPPPALES